MIITQTVESHLQSGEFYTLFEMRIVLTLITRIEESPSQMMPGVVY